MYKGKRKTKIRGRESEGSSSLWDFPGPLGTGDSGWTFRQGIDLSGGVVNTRGRGCDLFVFVVLFSKLSPMGEDEGDFGVTECVLRDQKGDPSVYKDVGETGIER